VILFVMMRSANDIAVVVVVSDIQKLWRGVPVDGVDERKIEEYLLRHNIVTMQDRVIKKVRISSTHRKYWFQLDVTIVSNSL